MVIKTITTSPATTALITGGTLRDIKTITVSNFSDNTADARFDLYYKQGATDAYIIKNCMIPKGATLVFDKGYYVPPEWSLFCYSTGTAPAITVIIQ